MASNTAQATALALLPKITGFLSAGFSTIIVYTILRDKEKRGKTYHRLLCGLSCVDISSSFWLGLSTWPIPSDSGVLWASGTDKTCTLQGFFTQFGIASSFYNASLSLYYLLVITRGWREEEIVRIEPVLHAFPVLWALGTASASVSLDILGNALLWCWISASADKYRWAFFYGPLWLMIFLVTLNCILIFLHVRKVERASDMYRFRQAGRYNNSNGGGGGGGGRPESSVVVSEDSQVVLHRHDQNSTPGDEVQTHPDESNDSIELESSSHQHDDEQPPPRPSISRRRSSGIRSGRRRSRDVAAQCFLYAAAFYFNWVALTVTRILQTVNGKTYFPLLLIAAMTTPLQGLPNALVYLRPKFIKVRRERPNAGVWNWFKGSLAVTDSPAGTTQHGNVS